MDMVIRQGIFFVQCGKCRAVLQFHIVAVNAHNALWRAFRLSVVPMFDVDAVIPPKLAGKMQNHKISNLISRNYFAPKKHNA